VDLSDAVRPSRIEKDALSRSGLAGIDVRHDADVPAALQWNCSRHSFLSFLFTGLVFTNDIYWAAQNFTCSAFSS
jgi:hypothetical protein